VGNASCVGRFYISNPDHSSHLLPSEGDPLTPYGRDVLYTLGVTGWMQRSFTSRNLPMAVHLVRYKILPCTVPSSFYEMCNQILADECDDRLAISRRHNRFQYSKFQSVCTTCYEPPTIRTENNQETDTLFNLQGCNLLQDATLVTHQLIHLRRPVRTLHTVTQCTAQDDPEPFLPSIVAQCICYWLVQISETREGVVEWSIEKIAICVRRRACSQHNGTVPISCCCTHPL